MTPSPTENTEEPTIEWLINELVPNTGNSPLVNFNKRRLRQAIVDNTSYAVQAFGEKVLEESVLDYRDKDGRECVVIPVSVLKGE